MYSCFFWIIGSREEMTSMQTCMSRLTNHEWQFSDAFSTVPYMLVLHHHLLRLSLSLSEWPPSHLESFTFVEMIYLFLMSKLLLRVCLCKICEGRELCNDSQMLTLQIRKAWVSIASAPLICRTTLNKTCHYLKPWFLYMESNKGVQNRTVVRAKRW